MNPIMPPRRRRRRRTEPAEPTAVEPEVALPSRWLQDEQQLVIADLLEPCAAPAGILIPLREDLTHAGCQMESWNCERKMARLVGRAPVAREIGIYLVLQFVEQLPPTTGTDGTVAL